MKQLKELEKNLLEKQEQLREKLKGFLKMWKTATSGELNDEKLEYVTICQKTDGLDESPDGVSYMFRRGLCSLCSCPNHWSIEDNEGADLEDIDEVPMIDIYRIISNLEDCMKKYTKRLENRIVESELMIELLKRFQPETA